MTTSPKSANGGALPVAGAKVRLSPRATELLAERRGDLPIWVRASKTGVERYSGLSRAKLYELAGTGRIKSASLREPGKLRGCRLFDLRSILAYIESNVLEPSDPTAATSKTPTAD